MFWLAAAAMTVSTVPEGPPPTARVAAQATATIRIVTAVRLKLDSDHNEGAPNSRPAIFVSNGIAQPARLIEFE
jgi:hypothetical protein